MTKLSFICIILNFAYPHTFYPQNDPYQALKKEIEQYTQEHIEPLMRIQRARMDHYLSQNDLSILNQLRSEYHALKIKKQQIFDQYRDQGSKLMQAWHALRNRESDIWQEALQISYRYQKQINTLLQEEITADKRLWRMEMNLIVNKYNEQLDSHQVSRFKKHDFGDFMTPAGFLLWNLPKLEIQGAEAAAGPEIYPNPSILDSNIKFRLQKEEEVIVSILDRHGKLLKILLNKKLAAGEHDIKVSLTDISSNIYCYKIYKHSGTVVKKFIEE